MEKNNSIHAKAYFTLLKTSSWIEKVLKEALKPIGITHAQLNALYVLYKSHPQPLTANKVKKQLLVSSPDVTRLFDRLVKKGWVIRETCPENRRKIDIKLTNEGSRIFLMANFAAKQALGNFFKNKITENEASELRSILQKIRD